MISVARDLQLQDVELAERNTTVFVMRPSDPGREYLLWCLSQRDPRPNDAQVAVAVVPASLEIGARYSPRHISRRLGLRWRMESNAHGSTLVHEHQDDVVAVEFSPKGDFLASLGRDGQVKVWDIAAKRDTAGLRPMSPKTGRSLAIAPDGKTIYVGYENPVSIARWDVQSAALVAELPGSGTTGGLVALSSDGNRLVTFAANDANGTEGSFINWDSQKLRSTSALATQNKVFEQVRMAKSGFVAAVGRHIQNLDGMIRKLAVLVVVDPSSTETRLAAAQYIERVALGGAVARRKPRGVRLRRRHDASVGPPDAASEVVLPRASGVGRLSRVFRRRSFHRIGRTR
jgi:hypothetical protein